MSGTKWWVAADDVGGIMVEPLEVYQVGPHDVVYDDEFEAVSYAIDCAEGRRTAISDSIARLKARRRALKNRQDRATQQDSSHD